jgi:hypothetical protein
MCCASREPAQNFEQYIDTTSGSGKYIPLTLEQHWNSEHMKSVRRRMMAGETLSECEVCNDKLLNTSVYRSYFNQLFGDRYDLAMASTDATGLTSMQPLSWDYRFSNLCNFKCRTCGDMLSSAWESEQRQHDMINWNNTKNNWMIPAVRAEISKFQDTQIEEEFAQAVREHRVEEVYWVGGEPLMFEQHWRYMKQIVDQGDGDRVYARYNTNLSRVDFKGISLYDDILCHLRDYQICASLDGTGAVGEYIRTGLNYSVWRDNFARGVATARNRRQWRIDFTLTLPGLFEVENIQALAREFNVDILAKVIFSFSPDIIMSPLALPRLLLNEWVDELLLKTTGEMHNILEQLKHRPNFEEQWPDTYAKGLAEGKARVLQLESIRPCNTSMTTILATRPAILEWWNSIDNKNNT